MKQEKDKIKTIEEPDNEFSASPSTLRRIERRHKASADDTDLKNMKVTMTIRIDADILEFFKDRAAATNAAPYQTQINNALREYMENSASPDLAHDPAFIKAVAEQVKRMM